MSVGRKESNNLVEKAGKAIIDLAFSLSSRNAISNAACSEGMRLRNVTLYNGKLYQLGLDGQRGDEIKMSGLVNLVEREPKDNMLYYSSGYGQAISIVTTKFKVSVPNCYYSGEPLINSHLINVFQTGNATGYMFTPTTSWRSSNNCGWRSKNQWGTEIDVTFDLFKPKKVENVAFIDEVLGNRNKTLYSVQLQCSDDGVNWTNASDVFDKVETTASSTEVERCRINLDVTTDSAHRYWRLHYTRPENTSVETVGFVSIAFMGYNN